MSEEKSNGAATCEKPCNPSCAEDFNGCYRTAGVAMPVPVRHAASGAWECQMTGFPCPNNCERPCGVQEAGRG